MNKMVSIVMPAYNAEKFFSKSVQSVINQTYKDWELIIVNDESTDGTLKSALSYAEKDKRIRVESIKHGGVSVARNSGYELAKGEYLQFMDADDELDVTFLEKMVGLLETNDADLAICRFSHPFFKTYVENRVYDLTKKNDLIELYQDCYGVVMPWNRVWKRKCFTVPFDVDVHFSEDELGNLANLPNVKKVATTSECLYFYFIAGKENDEKEDSCVNNIINSVAFWDNQTSFYYMGASLLPKRQAIIEKAIKDGDFPLDSSDEMAYYRLVDYCFWQMPAYIGMGIPQFGLTKECRHIFDDERFLKGIDVQKVYGFERLKLSETETDKLTEQYVDLCYKAYEAHGTEPDFAIAYVFIMLYLRLFTKVCGTLNAINLQAKFILNMQNNSTKEAIFVNGLLNK